jgi:hypothetical protein
VQAARIPILAACTGVGMMISALWVAATAPHRGQSYVRGTAVAMLLLLGFALFDSYGLVLASLFASSVAFGFFSSTQGALIMTSVPDAMRGRAMGLLSMAIGSLPFGMWGLGELAEVVGAPRGLAIYNLLGVTALAIWIWFRPEVYRTR